MLRLIGTFALLISVVAVVTADPDEPVITAETLADLQPQTLIDFDDIPADAGEMASGWLRVDREARYAVTANRASDLVLWDIVAGEFESAWRVPGTDGTNANMMDIAWEDAGTRIYSLHTDGAAYYVGAYVLADDAVDVLTIPAEGDRPVRVWAGDDATVWVEVLPSDPNAAAYVLEMDVMTGDVLQELPSVAEADRDSQVRIGRMPAPLAVTSAVDGNVQLWDLETGDLLHRVTLDIMPTFGHINGAAGRELVWRDTMSEDLYVLDFETGENRPVAVLDGAYVQALLLGAESDVVLGVNIDRDPVVVGWPVATGARVELGTYRACNRTPDMVQLSEDGTALVIGCDTGLEIWRVSAE